MRINEIVLKFLGNSADRTFEVAMELIGLIMVVLYWNIWSMGSDSVEADSTVHFH